MDYKITDRVKETTTVTGTGVISLLGSVVGFIPFSSFLSIGDTCPYVIANSSGSEWETGIATYSAINQLTRTQVYTSSNNNLIVSFSDGAKDVFVSPISKSLIDYDPISKKITNAIWDAEIISVSKGGTNSSTASGARTSLGLVIGTDILAPTGSAASLTNFPTLNQNTTGTASNVTGIVAIENGGTNSSTASGARTSLGLAIGTDVLAPTGSAANLTNFPTLNQNTTGTASNVTGIVAIENGGTGATTGNQALINIGGISNIISTDGSISIASSGSSKDLSVVKYSALTYTYTGTLNTPPIIILANPLPNQNGDVISDYSGVWAQKIIISKNNFNLTSIAFTNLKGIVEDFYLDVLPAITSISLPNLTTIAGNFNLSNMNALTSIDFPVLTTCGDFITNDINAVTSMSFPYLTTCGNFLPNNMNALTSMNFPALTTCDGDFRPSNINYLTSMDFSALKTIGGNFFIYNVNSLASMSFPSLTTCGNFAPMYMALLTSITFSSIINFGITFNPYSSKVIALEFGTDGLTTFQLPSTLKRFGTATSGDVSITSAALNQASVDNILIRLAFLDGNNNTTLFSNKNITITGTSSTPSASGLAAKAQLISRGCTVITN